MYQTTRTYNGMVVAPHHLAAEAGARILREGGNAVEAMIAAVSTIAVVYPHMNNLGGDNFWLIHTPGEKPFGIDACGGAAALAGFDFYRERECTTIPSRGPLAALTVAGAVSGWQTAHLYGREILGGKLPLSRLLEEAIFYAKQGVSVTATLAMNAEAKLSELELQPGFAKTYLASGELVREGEKFKQQHIGETLEILSRNGLNDFYHGEVASTIAADLEAVGSPIRLADLNRHQALAVEPLSLDVAGHKVFNMPPPTQGLASLLLLGIYDRLGIHQAENFNYVHGLVEATKCAFRIRDRYVTDPAFMEKQAASYLNVSDLEKMTASIDTAYAAPWPGAAVGGDTVWLGAIDNQGRAVSFIQSIYWEFGSGVILPQTGITWQNRGISFSLDPENHNSLQPYRRPFHTIQPALAQLSDGRVMPYGAMGGEGQPQTQAMIFTRHVLHRQPLQQAISAPRWLLGRTWGSDATNLRIENRFNPDLYDQLRTAGHNVEIIGEFDEIMGHAGARVHHRDGLIEGAWDPRSDGAAVGF